MRRRPVERNARGLLARSVAAMALATLALSGVPSTAQTLTVSGSPGAPETRDAGSSSNRAAIATIALAPSGRVILRELRLANTGTSLPGDASGTDLRSNELGAEIAGLQLWEDADDSGALGSADRVIGTAAWSALRKRFVFSGLDLELIAPRRLFVTLGAGTGAIPGKTFAVSLLAGDVVLAAGTVSGGASGTVVTFAAGPVAGNTASSAPMVVIVNPGDATTVTSPFRLQARVFDPDGLAGVTVALSTDDGVTFPTPLVRNASYAGGNAGVYEPATGGLTLAPGLYTLRVRATDGANATVSRQVVVAVGAGRGDGNLLVRDNSSQLCSACHALQAHSSEANPKQPYGAWGVACRDCHTPHRTTNLSLVKPLITPNPVNGYEGAKGVTFSATTGDSATTDVAGASYANPDGSGPCQVCHTRTKSKAGVARWRRSGNEDAAHYAASGPNGSQRCTRCHLHTSGFVHGAGGAGCDGCHGHDAGWQGSPSLGKGTYRSHSTHTEDDLDDRRGPFLACDACHDTASFPAFRAGADANGDGAIDLSEATVCDGCHSRGGPHDGVDDPAIGAKALWRAGVYAGATLQQGRERWCVGCHDSGSSVIPAGSGRAAPDVAGDATTYGYYASGHGARGTECATCHDLAARHNFDGQKTYSGASDNYQAGYRLRSVAGGPPMNVPLEPTQCASFVESDYALCFSCHSASALLADTKPRGVYGCTSNPYKNAAAITTGFRNLDVQGNAPSMGAKPDDLPANVHADHLIDVSFVDTSFWYSSGGSTGVSATTCVMCHDPHGDRRSDGSATPKMTRGMFEVTHASDVYGAYGAITGTTWSSSCSYACHGNGRWYATQFLTMLGVTLGDANRADPAPAEPGYTNQRLVTVTIANTGAPSEMLLAEDPGFTVGATGWIPYSASTSYTLGPGDGAREVYVKLRNADGESQVGNAAITLDMTAPTVPAGAVTAPNGGETWDQGTTRTVTWSGVADANLAAAPVALAYSTDRGASYPNTVAVGEANDGAYEWSLPVVETTTARVRLTVTDRAGNRAFDASDADFTIRAVAPTLASVTVADRDGADPSPAEAGFTNASEVAVELVATRFPAEVMLAEDPGFTQNATGWLPYAASLTYALSPADGAKTVWAKVRNGGGESAPASAAIHLDRTPPAVAATALSAPNGVEAWPQGSAQVVTWSPAQVADANLKAAPISLAYSSDSGASYPSPIAAGEANDGSHPWAAPRPASYRARVRLTATDRAGNESHDVSDADFLVTTPWVVTTTADVGPGSLRQVLADLLAAGGGDTVWFRIPAASLASGVGVVSLASALPTIDQPGVTIDAGSQTRLVGDTNARGPEVRLQGWTLATSSAVAFSVTGANATIRGFQLTGFHHPIHTSGAGTVVQGNHFCFRSDAVTPYTASANGAGVIAESASTGVLVGGPTPEDRNFFAGCSGDATTNASGVNARGTNGRVENNFFGLLPGGAELSNALARPNVYVAGTDNLVQGNQISGGSSGVYLFIATRARVKGNILGRYWDGSTWHARTPQPHAIHVAGSDSGCVIGGPRVAASDGVLNDSNVISAAPSGSYGYGVFVRHNNPDPTKIHGNFIGTNPGRTQVFSGRVGVYLDGFYGQGTRIGGTGAGEAGNVIANMAQNGVLLGTSASYVTISANSFRNNGTSAAGSDDAIAYVDTSYGGLRPVISAASTTAVTVTGVASGDVVEVYESDYDGTGTEYGEGVRLLRAAAATGPSVDVDVSTAGLASGRWITALRRTSSGTTYPFSANVRVP